MTKHVSNKILSSFIGQIGCSKIISKNSKQGGGSFNRSAWPSVWACEWLVVVRNLWVLFGCFQHLFWKGMNAFRIVFQCKVQKFGVELDHPVLCSCSCSMYPERSFKQWIHRWFHGFFEGWRWGQGAPDQCRQTQIKQLNACRNLQQEHSHWHV